MRVGLVNPRVGGEPQIGLPHGLLQLGAEVEASGHTFEIVDYNNPAVALDYSALRKFDVVGLSVTTPQLRHATQIVSSLAPGTPVVWGGAHCLIDPLSVLNRYPEHWVVRGEGEAPLMKILEHLERGTDRQVLSECPGIAVLGLQRPVVNDPACNEDVEKLADIDYRRLPRLEDYLRKDYYLAQPTKMLGVLVARGCPWDCSFCINTLLPKHGGGYRQKSMAKIRREIDAIVEGLGIRVVLLSEEDSLLRTPLVDEWMKYAQERDLLWEATCRFNYFSPKLIDAGRLRAFVDNGLFSIAMSAEAGDEGVRNQILNKRLTDEQIVSAVRIIEASVGRRIALNVSYVVGFPGDTRANRVKIIEQMNLLSSHLNVLFSGPQAYRPYPGTRLYAQVRHPDSGSLEHYLQTTDATATPAVSRTAEITFYTRLVTTFFNRRFRFYRLTDDPAGGSPLALDDSPLHRRANPKSHERLTAVLLGSVALRLRLRFWRFFIEPRILGFLVKLAAGCRRRLPRRDRRSALAVRS